MSAINQLKSIMPNFLLNSILLVVIFYCFIGQFAAMAPAYAHVATYGLLAVIMSVIFFFVFRREAQ